MKIPPFDFLSKKNAAIFTAFGLEYSSLLSVYDGIGDAAVDLELHHTVEYAVGSHAVCRVGAGFVDEIDMMLEGLDRTVHTVTADTGVPIQPTSQPNSKLSDHTKVKPFAL